MIEPTACSITLFEARRTMHAARLQELYERMCPGGRGTDLDASLERKRQRDREFKARRKAAGKEQP